MFVFAFLRFHALFAYHAVFALRFEADLIERKKHVSVFYNVLDKLNKIRISL